MANGSPHESSRAQVPGTMTWLGDGKKQGRSGQLYLTREEKSLNMHAALVNCGDDSLYVFCNCSVGGGGINGWGIYPPSHKSNFPSSVHKRSLKAAAQP